MMKRQSAHERPYNFPADRKPFEAPYGIPGKRAYDMEHGVVQAALAQIINGLAGDGEAIIKAMNNPEQSAEIIKFLVSGAWYKETEEETKFREIMGKNFIGIKEALSVMGARILCSDGTHGVFGRFSPDARRIFLRDGRGGPVAQDTENICRDVAKNDQYVLVYYPGIERSMRQHILGVDFGQTDTVDRDGWYLIRKSPHPNSFWLKWKEQIELLNKECDDVVDAQIVQYALTIGKDLFKEGYSKVYGRCSDTVGGIETYHTICGFDNEVNHHCVQAEDVGLATIRIGYQAEFR